MKIKNIKFLKIKVQDLFSTLEIYNQAVLFFYSFPEDPHYRLWQPFKDDNTDVVSSQSSITTSEFWNKPPAKAFATAITMSTTKKLDVQWPPGLLPSTRYHVSLYFRDDRNSKKTNTWRVFSILVNGKTFYSNLNVTTDGVTVYAPNWPLSGKTLISLTPDTKSSIAPLINAGEIYQLMPLAGRTLPQDGTVFSDHQFWHSPQWL